MFSDAPAPHPTAFSPASSPALAKEQISYIYEQYAALAATIPLDAELGLGGKLLYVGAIDAAGRALLFAANVAGAAMLAASADPAAQRAAIRDGVVDFFVTSLEEALRILKNEIRKRQAVSVGVAVAPEALAAAMLERGVLPDLVADADSVAGRRFAADGARVILPAEAGEFVSWSVDQGFARWLPRLDAAVQSVVPAGDVTRQRWLRLAPRYLGRMAQREHGITLSATEVAAVRERVREMRASFEDGGEVAIRIGGELV